VPSVRAAKPAITVFFTVTVIAFSFLSGGKMADEDNGSMDLIFFQIHSLAL
jgi:hypothetical protein